MNIKSVKNYFFLIILIVFIGCQKQSENKLAKNYYKMAIVELQEENNRKYAYKKALSNIDKALMLEKKPEYLALKATMLFELGYESLGQTFFNKAFDLATDNKLKKKILNNKACLFAQIGMFNKDNDKIDYAFNIWQKLENDKDYLTPEVALFNQSKVFVYKNDYKNAKYKLENAIKLSPNYLDAHYYLALVDYNLADFLQTKNQLDTVLFLYPDHKGALNLKKLIEKA